MSLKSFIDKVCRQVLVYWQRDKPDGSGGWTYKKPVELACRWEDVMQEVIGPDGRTRISNSHVIIRDQMIENGAIIWLGTIVEWKKLPTYPKIPTASQKGFEVFKAGHTPGFKGENLLFEAWI